MNKFTDRFFAFPIKIYDSLSLGRAMEFEESVGMKADAEWITGVARISAKDLENITWQDGYSNGRTIVEVKEEGFDLTIVYTEIWGEYICMWTRKKFEEKLNEFMARQPQEKEENNLTL